MLYAKYVMPAGQRICVPNPALHRTLIWSVKGVGEAGEKQSGAFYAFRGKALIHTASTIRRLNPFRQIAPR